MKKDLRGSFWLKAVCYIAIPIMIAIIILNIIVMVSKDMEPDLLSADSFYETSSFTDRYSVNLQNIKVFIDDGDYKDYSNDFPKHITSEGETIIYNINIYSSLEYVIIDNKTKTAYTNLDITANTDTFTELKEYFNQKNSAYWFLENGKVNTNMPNLEKENLSYSSNLFKVVNDSDGYSIYSVIKNNNSEYKEMAYIYDIARDIEGMPYEAITVILVFLTGAGIIYLIASIGHKNGHDGIHINLIDKIPIELLLLLVILWLFIGLSINSSVWDGYVFQNTNIIRFIIIVIIQSIIVYIITAIVATTIIKRLKGHTIIKTSFAYMIYEGLTKTAKNMFENRKLTFKLGVLYGGFLLILLIASIGILSAGSTFGVMFFFLGAIAFMIYAFFKILNYFKRLEEIKGAIEKIYNGNNDIVLIPEELKGEQKEVAIYINDIAGGLSNAIEQSIKSERFKTELITNVSHDIKTPLTSIINYVDLLRQENIENDKAKEYIEILDSKSQRLKKLTEDLVEASKASSGNVKLTMKRINVVELIKQATGEFEDKFNNTELEVITKTEEKEMYIMADTRYIYRVIENIFSNISKYALENSRVYIDILSKDNKIIISIKNISKEALNITSDELMQRFVRGDKSRTTEGSGLGLSIAKSLTEIQGGKFNIQIDGDLFKVDMIFEI